MCVSAFHSNHFPCPLECPHAAESVSDPQKVLYRTNGAVESLGRESLQYGCLKTCVGLYAADTISKVGLRAELGVWRIDSMHKMGALPWQTLSMNDGRFRSSGVSHS